MASIMWRKIHWREVYPEYLVLYERMHGTETPTPPSKDVPFLSLDTFRRMSPVWGWKSDPAWECLTCFCCPVVPATLSLASGLSHLDIRWCSLSWYKYPSPWVFSALVYISSPEAGAAIATWMRYNCTVHYASIHINIFAWLFLLQYIWFGGKVHLANRPGTGQM